MTRMLMRVLRIGTYGLVFHATAMPMRRTFTLEQLRRRTSIIRLWQSRGIPWLPSWWNRKARMDQEDAATIDVMKTARALLRISPYISLRVRRYLSPQVFWEWSIQNPPRTTVELDILEVARFQIKKFLLFL